MDGPAVAELMASVAAAVSRRVAAVSEDVYEVILREIPELRDDQVVLALLDSSVQSNVGTCLQIMQHQIDLSVVRAPAASLEYARRRAQRGTPLPALLRAYRAREPWCEGRLIITPHSAFFTPEAWDDIRLKSAETMRAAMVGPRPQNVITPEMF